MSAASTSRRQSQPSLFAFSRKELEGMAENLELIAPTVSPEETLTIGQEVGLTETPEVAGVVLRVHRTHNCLQHRVRWLDGLEHLDILEDDGALGGAWGDYSIGELTVLSSTTTRF